VSLRRLNIIDFDDTLAWSGQAVETMRKRSPDTPERDWWHDPNASTAAAEITKPIVSMWEHVATLPGESVILTGRVLAPVLRWLGMYSTDPEIAEGISRIMDVMSTSGKGWPAGSTTSARKALWVNEKCGKYDEIHVYDDHPSNLQTIQGVCPDARLHQIVGGFLINPRGWSWHRVRGHDYPPT